VRLYGINFDTDSDKLKDESKTTLDAVKKVLDAHADWKITIGGHTDATSTHEHNQTLSEQRAAAVKAYLVKAGIAADRLDTAGLAETKPVAPNTDAMGRAQNRRVELVKR
jgi:outer membrane protein OmpA-like peptidoglycan-associated protein